MSHFKAFDIAGSAMSAQNQRLNLVASNMANVDTVSSSIEKTYRSRQPVFQAILNAFDPDRPASGVRTLGVIESQAPLRKEYRPDHPLADEQGYIHKPNVNMVEEMANMISASRSYQSNVEVMNAAKRMAVSTINLGK